MPTQLTFKIKALNSNLWGKCGVERFNTVYVWRHLHFCFDDTVDIKIDFAEQMHLGLSFTLKLGFFLTGPYADKFAL